MVHRTRVQGRPVADYPQLPPETLRGRVRRITEVGEDVLHRPCRQVAAADFGTPGLSALVDDLFATLYVAEGAGLAANQIGVALRLFVWDCTDEDGVRHVGHIVNPLLEEPPVAGRRLAEVGEGCLSVPGPYRDVARPDRAVVRGWDKDGHPLTVEGSGYFARCLQHECDHLLGGLYLDRLSTRARRSALREMARRRDEVLARREVMATALAGR
ncbi:peptide deformylase [Kitasatospora nipponensis]|uniref:Peptide deformylase n=1 Tax=Kitasatospora nipponensis TaxID=258049 RepID=A0ABN1W386_9ACTN